MTKSGVQKKKIIIEINFEFESQFQHDSAMDSLALMLKAWTTFYLNNHKKNKITYDLKEVEKQQTNLIGMEKEVKKDK